MFYPTRGQTYWGLAHIVVFSWYSDLIAHTVKHKQGTQGPVDWHTYINIHLHHLLCAPPVMCSQKLPLLHWVTKRIIHWYQKFTFHNDFFFKTYSLVLVTYLLWCYTTRIFMWNANNTNKSDVNENKQNTPTQKKTRLESVS